MKRLLMSLAALACLSLPARACPGAVANFGFNSGFAVAPAFTGFSVQTFAAPVAVPLPVVGFSTFGFNSFGFGGFNNAAFFGGGFGFRGGHGFHGGLGGVRINQRTRIRGRF